MKLACPHCHKELELALVSPGSVHASRGYLDPVSSVPPAPKKKAKHCACGHDAHEGKCPHGAGGIFGGCPCTGQHTRARKTVDSRTGEEPAMGSGERSILQTIAQLGTPTSVHLTISTGYKRSTRDAYLARLTKRGYVERHGGTWSATREGVKAAGPFDPLPTGDRLRLHHLERLPEGESTVLAFVCRFFPDPVRRDTISDATGYKRSTRDAYVHRLLARKLLHEGHEPGEVQASPTLFDGGT